MTQEETETAGPRSPRVSWQAELLWGPWGISFLRSHETGRPRWCWYASSGGIKQKFWIMGYPHPPTFRLEHWEGLCTVSLMNYFQELYPALSFPGSRGSFVWDGTCPLPSVSLPVAPKAVTSSPTSSTFRVYTYRLWGFSGYCSGKLIGSSSSWPLLHSSIQLIWWYVTLPGWSQAVSEEGPTLIVFEEVILPAPFMGPSTILPLCFAGDGVESTGKCSPTASPKGKNLVICCFTFRFQTSEW